VIIFTSTAHVPVLNLVILQQAPSSVRAARHALYLHLHGEDGQTGGLEEAGSRGSAGKQGDTAGTNVLSLIPAKL